MSVTSAHRFIEQWKYKEQKHDCNRQTNLFSVRKWSGITCHRRPGRVHAEISGGIEVRTDSMIANPTDLRQPILKVMHCLVEKSYAHNVNALCKELKGRSDYVNVDRLDILHVHSRISMSGTIVRNSGCPIRVGLTLNILDLVLLWHRQVAVRTSCLHAQSATPPFQYLDLPPGTSAPFCRISNFVCIQQEMHSGVSPCCFLHCAPRHA